MRHPRIYRYGFPNWTVQRFQQGRRFGWFGIVQVYSYASGGNYETSMG